MINIVVCLRLLRVNASRVSRKQAVKSPLSNGGWAEGSKQVNSHAWDHMSLEWGWYRAAGEWHKGTDLRTAGMGGVFWPAIGSKMNCYFLFHIGAISSYWSEDRGLASNPRAERAGTVAQPQTPRCEFPLPLSFTVYLGWFRLPYKPSVRRYKMSME